MLRLSSGLQNALLRDKNKIVYLLGSTTLSIEAGAGINGSDRISDATNLASFPGALVGGDSLTIMGANANAMKTGVIVGFGTGYIDVNGGGMVDMAAGTQAFLVGAIGGSIAGIFRNGCIRIYTGTQPATANDGETGTLLVEITQNSQPHSTGVSGTNGLNLGQPSNGVIGKAPGEVWAGSNVASGTAGWFRFYANDKTLGASSEAIRLDGACSTSTSQLRLSTTNLVAGVTTTVDGVQISAPAN